MYGFRNNPDPFFNMTVSITLLCLSVSFRRFLASLNSFTVLTIAAVPPAKLPTADRPANSGIINGRNPPVFGMGIIRGVFLI